MIFRYKNYIQESIHSDIDPYGEEEWNDTDKIYYSICTGSKDNSFIVKVEKVYLNNIKKSYVGMDGYENYYFVELMGGLKIDINVYFDKISIKDLIRKQKDSDYGTTLGIEYSLKIRNILIQEKAMTIDEIKKLAVDIYELGSYNKIIAMKSDIDSSKRRIKNLEDGIDRMENNKLIEYKIDDIKIEPPQHNIFNG